MDSTFILLLVGRVLQIVLSLVSVRIYTKALSTAEVGNLYLIGSIVGLFALALVNPVGMYINRRLHKWADDKTIIDYFFVFNLYLIFLSILSILVVYVFNKFFGIGSGIDLKLLSVFIMLNLYFNTWNPTIIGSFNMLNYRRSFVAFSLITQALGLVLSITIVKTVSPSAVLWLSGQLAAQVLVSVVAFVYFKRITKSSFDSCFIKKVITKENLGYLITFALPLGVTTFFLWVQNQSYRLIIEKYVGLEFLGMIGVGMAIASSIAAAVESLAQQIYFPAFYSEINTLDPVKRAAAWNKMAQLTIPIYVSVAILVSCLAPFLVKVLVNDKFSQVSIFVVYGSWVELFRMTTNILSSVAHSEMQTKYLIKAYFAGGLFATLGVYLCSMQNWLQIIPIVLVISGFVTMAILYFNMQKLLDISIRFNHIFKSVVLSSLFATAILFYPRSVNLLFSVSIVIGLGIYFVIIQYYLFNQTVKQDL